MKKLSKHQVWLTNARIAGYHHDATTFTRLIIEARVARDAMNKAWRTGQEQRKNGMPCGCWQCNHRRAITMGIKAAKEMIPPITNKEFQEIYGLIEVKK